MTEPQTEAGRAFCAALRANRVWPIKKPMNTTPEQAILAIEQEARHATLAEVRRGVEALWQGRGWLSIEDSAAKQAVLRILDAAETPQGDTASEYGRLLAERDRLIGDGADPADLEMPLPPEPSA